MSSFKSSQVIADLEEVSVIKASLSRQKSPLEVNHSDKNWSTWSKLILCGLDRFSSVFGWHLFLTSVTIIEALDIIYEQIKFDILSYFLWHTLVTWDWHWHSHICFNLSESTQKDIIVLFAIVEIEDWSWSPGSTAMLCQCCIGELHATLGTLV